jgi:2-dehydro-3-deoxygalactonokinase
MTGEIFEMLRKHSILSHAVGDPAVQEISEGDKKSFTKGVGRALSDELLNILFSVRINQLKGYLSPEQNYFYLSGLLIGSELKYITENIKYKLVLCSTGGLLQLYRTAVEFAGLSEHTIVVPAEIPDNAAMAGQLKILNSIKSI